MTFWTLAWRLRRASFFPSPPELLQAAAKLWHRVLQGVHSLLPQHPYARSSAAKQHCCGCGNRGLTVRILALQASGPGSTPGGCTFCPADAAILR